MMEQRPAPRWCVAVITLAQRHLFGFDAAVTATTGALVASMVIRVGLAWWRG